MDAKKINTAIDCSFETVKRPPSFFIYGESGYALETGALAVAEEIKRNPNMRFRGIVKSFSIKMPYFSDTAGSAKFLGRLDESMNIAADFYSEFKGIVIIELSADWVTNGLNSAFSCLPGYIGMHRDISYVVIVEAKEGSPEIEKIERTLSGSVPWVNEFLKAAEIGQCVKLFLDSAANAGLTVTEEAVQKLRETLEQADTSVLPLEQVVQYTVLQIKLNKRVGNAKPVIDAGDLEIVPRRAKNENQNRIGFSAAV